MTPRLTPRLTPWRTFWTTIWMLRARPEAGPGRLGRFSGPMPADLRPTLAKCLNRGHFMQLRAVSQKPRNSVFSHALRIFCRCIFTGADVCETEPKSGRRSGRKPGGVREIQRGTQIRKPCRKGCGGVWKGARKRGRKADRNDVRKDPEDSGHAGSGNARSGHGNRRATVLRRPPTMRLTQDPMQKKARSFRYIQKALRKEDEGALPVA